MSTSIETEAHSSKKGISAIFSTIFSPAPHGKPIEDTGQIERDYKYWRVRIFYSMYLGYTFYYFSRNSFSAAKPLIGSTLGFTNSELGIVTSMFAIAYGISKFASGILSDRSNARYFMATGLIVTGVLNIFFGMTSSIWLFSLLWGLNGWFQGFGWPPVGRLLTHWYSQSERGRWWGAWNTSHNIGGLLIPFIVAGAANAALYYGSSQAWRYGLYLPGILAMTMGFVLLNRLRDTPQSLGLPSVEHFRGDYGAVKAADTEKKPSVREILFKYVLSNKYIWVLAISYIFIYIIRSGVTEWIPKFFVETKGYSQLVAASAITWFEIGGVAGAITAGWASDKIFGGRRGPVNTLFTIGALIAVASLWVLSSHTLAENTFQFSLSFFKQEPIVISLAAVVNNVLVGLTGFFIFGPQMLIGIAAAELSHKQAVGTATGFIGIFANVGLALTGYPLGKVIDSFGWQGLFFALIFSGVIVSCLLMTLWKVTAKPMTDS